MNLNRSTPSLPVTDTWIEVHFQGPRSRRHEVYQKMRELGFESVAKTAPNDPPQEEFIPWREEFTEYTDEEMVGITLKETRLANLTQRQLSQLTGIPQRQLSEIERGKRAVDKQVAKQLAKVLEVDYRVFFST
jgi:ribosome-binding protein aMBF1 (putative translation factor)